MKKKSIAVLLFISSFSNVFAGNFEGPVKGYFDNSFFGALSFIYSKLLIFQDAANQLGRLLFFVDIAVLGILLIFGLGELYKELIKKLFTLAIVAGLLYSWSSVFMGTTEITLSIANIPAKEAIGTADFGIKDKMDALYKKYMLAKATGEQLTRIDPFTGQEISSGKAKADQILEQYTILQKSLTGLKIWGYGSTVVPGTTKAAQYNQYIRPEALLMYTQALLAPIWADAETSGLDVGRALMRWATVFLCFVLASLMTIQYIMCMFEWAILGVVAILFIPTALFSGTRFMSEKLIGTITGHMVKIIVMFTIIGIVTGLLFKLSTGTYYGTQDQILNLIFSFFMFFMTTTKIPELAQGFMGSGPSLGFGSFMQTARGVAAGALSGSMLAKKAAGSSYHASHAMAGAAGQAAGAAMAANRNGKSGTLAAIGSLAGSLGSGVRSASTQARQSMLGNSVFRGRNALSGGGGGVGGGIQDRGDAEYQQSLNPDTNYQHEMATPRVIEYFNVRMKEQNIRENAATAKRKKAMQEDNGGKS
jgi:type IV secretory pathway TrbL component